MNSITLTKYTIAGPPAPDDVDGVYLFSCPACHVEFAIDYGRVRRNWDHSSPRYYRHSCGATPGCHGRDLRGVPSGEYSVVFGEEHP